MRPSRKGQELAKQLDSLNIEKQRVEADIVALRQEKTGLMDQVASLNTLSEKQKAKLNSMHYIVASRPSSSRMASWSSPSSPRTAWGQTPSPCDLTRIYCWDGPAEPLCCQGRGSGRYQDRGRSTSCPARSIKDQHYTISYAADRSSATVKILGSG